ncbi:hypothetical protein DR62_06040 [Burkholderia thailandensis]|uniref:Uncharacterized protein n=1 Tax=Burkholderia thailandensis TaxID=57975 RepID=A0AAW9CZI8_BURTH|nr:hypothetical protein DR62_06040 [Burkholderia thailandensis]AOI50493.1 hypothetical protein WI24_00890 [Burkholderia thailandensis]AOJ46770.1 hypothetical protein WJ27_17760 [Burkholderia thailandensis]AOJ49531.1 hypothetical protein AQ475_00875 [Burkholderia thailandensis]AOJ55248.1 hypothetical protein AQ477_01090 [Burkholderia thailandensis]
MPCRRRRAERAARAVALRVCESTNRARAIPDSPRAAAPVKARATSAHAGRRRIAQAARDATPYVR